MLWDSEPAWHKHGCLWEVVKSHEDYPDETVGLFYREEDAYRVYNELEELRMTHEATYGSTLYVYNIKVLWGNDDPDAILEAWRKRY